MRNSQQQLYLIPLLTAGVLFVFPFPAHAYIDLGLAGQVFQVFYLIFIAALAFLISPILFFWKRIARWLKIGRKKQNQLSKKAEIPAGQETQQDD